MNKTEKKVVDVQGLITKEEFEDWDYIDPSKFEDVEPKKISHCTGLHCMSKNELKMEFKERVRNSWYSQTYCDGWYCLKTSAINDLLKCKNNEDFVKFVRSKMNKKTTKWYCGELTFALNWFGFMCGELEGCDELSELFFNLYKDFTDWVYNMSGNQKLSDFVYEFCN